MFLWTTSKFVIQYYNIISNRRKTFFKQLKRNNNDGKDIAPTDLKSGDPVV